MQKGLLHFLKRKLRRVAFLQKPYSKVKVFLIKKKRYRCLHKYGYEVLNEITENILQTNIQVFCAFGTLLGFVRDEGFISSDDDIDIGILETEDFTWERLENCLVNIGMKKSRQFELNEIITEQTYVKKGVCVDFFLYRKNEKGLTANVYWIDNDRVYNHEGGHSVMYRDCPMIEKVRKVNLHSISVLVPENSEEYLIATYGKGWKIPDPDYRPEKYVRTEQRLEAQRVDF